MVGTTGNDYLRDESTPGGPVRWLGIGVGLAALAAVGVLWLTGALHTPAASGRIDPVARFLLAIAVILLVCQLLGALALRFRQPPVLGEIVGGLLLGPSALGLVFPGMRDWLFTPQVLSNVDKAAQLGLITFMFLLGCELRVDRLESRRVIGASVLGGMGLPFVCGVGLALLVGGSLAGPGTRPLSYALFFGLALAITALPVLARILVDLGLQGTSLGATAMSVAAIGDGVAWTTLTVILAATGLGSAGAALSTLGLAVALVLVTFLCVRPALAVLVRRAQHANLLLGILAVGAIGYAAITQLLGLHPVIGAFLFGLAVPRRSPVVDRISAQLQGFSVAILLPLFFAGVGLSTSIGLLGSSATHWLLFLAVLGVAAVTKFLGAGGGAKLAGLSGTRSRQLATLMNCRGVTELVVAVIGLQAGLINQLGFTILVLVAVLTTAVTVPLMRLVTRRDDTLLRAPDQPAMAGGAGDG